MAFQQFTFPQVALDLGLTLNDADLYSTVPTEEVRPEFLATVSEGSDLASAINTEKARSEFVIAPVLFELRRMLDKKFGLFSGVELNADSSRGLNGTCDFLITRSPHQHFISSPLLAVVEAKNDNLRYGLGQCIASMIAIQVINQEAKDKSTKVYGVVSTGSLWRFLQCKGSDVTIDLVEYRVDKMEKIMGILRSIIQSPP